MSSAPPQRQQPFSVKLVVVLIAVGLAAFAALVLLIAFAPEVGPVHGEDAPGLSVGATGFKGLTDLVARFHRTRQVRGSADLDTSDLVVVTLGLGNRPDDIERLLELRRGRGTLIVLPKWLTRPDPSHRGWVQAIAPGAGTVGAEQIGHRTQVRVMAPGPPADRFADGADVLDGLRVPVPAFAQTIAGEELHPVLSLANGDMLIARLGDQPHYIAADPDLFDNHGLGNSDQARAALQMIDALGPNPGGPVAFDLTVAGLARNDAPSLLKTALQPPFLAMTLALLFAALLAGLHGAFRFGQARREERAIAFGKAALVENSAGLIRLARREARLGRSYAEIVRQDAAQLAAAPPALQGEALDAYLDRLGKSGGPPFSALAARLAAARDKHELVAAARALFSWKKDIIR